MKHIETIKNTDRFGLHDSKVSKIEFVNHDLIFTFSEGFWETDKTGKLVRQRKNCKMIYKFMIAEDDELNLDIFEITSKKRKDIKFSVFSDMVSKCGFRIYREFRCGFTTQLILEGNTDKGYYSIMTQEIDEIVYECDD